MTFKGDAQNSRGLAWVTDAWNDNMVVRYAEGDEDFASTYTEVEATFTEHEGDLYYKADITGLEAGTEYVYTVGDISYDAWSDYYSFTTENSEEDEYSFLVYTDAQGSTQSEYNLFEQLVDLSVEEVPDVKFMLSLGDFVESGYKTEEWEMYFDAVDDYTPTIPHMGIIGNHETRDNGETEYLDSGLEYRLYFNNLSDSAESIRENLSGVDLDRWTGGAVENIEGSVYSFDYADVHFAALNSGTDWHNANTLKLLQAQTEWLEKDLSESDAKWKVILIHQGLYPAKIERYFGSRDVLEQIIDKYNVDLVLQGHDHMVARTYPIRAGEIISTDTPQTVEKGEGTVYFIPGSAGKKRYSDIETIPDYMSLVVNTPSTVPTYSVVNVSDNQLEIITKDINSNIIDRFTIADN